MEEQMEPEINIDLEYVSTLARKALDNPSLQVGDWGVEKLTGGLELGSAIYRLFGTANDGETAQSWSLILKAIQPDQAQDDPAVCHYWKRDPLAYQSGLLYRLSGQVTAPRCLDVRENADGSIWLCLEEIKDEHPRPWSLESYARAARQLGEFNGAYLAGRPLPDEPWVTHDWLRKYLQEAAPSVDYIRQNPADPIINRMLPGITLPLTLAIWEEHERMLKVLEAMPQGFCHQDAFERNLFYRGEELVVIDWTYAGIAPVGTETAALVGAALGVAGFPPSQAKQLDQACFENYLEGLRQAGYQPDPRQVRLCFCVTLQLRYVTGGMIGEMIPRLRNPATRQSVLDSFEQTEETAGQSDPVIVAYFIGIITETLKTLGLGSMLRVAARSAYHALRLSGKRRATAASPDERAA
jgi:hypothetical protein